MLETYYARISASHFYFYLALVLSHLLYGVDLYMIYIYVCIYVLFFYVYFILQQGTMDEQSDWMVQWSTLYKYIWNKIKKYCGFMKLNSLRPSDAFRRQ